MRRRQINPAQDLQRQGLRLIGGVFAAAGAVLTAIGVISFFGSFGSFRSGPPQYFWCAFLGLPLLGIGVGLLKFGFLGPVSRYVAGEVAPVATDTLNYMVDETKDSLRDVASAVGAGLFKKGTANTVDCKKCGRQNDAAARFCDQCGATMPTVHHCPKCQKQNDAAARFCDGCGERLAAGG